MVEHGSPSRYRNHGCRCDLCRAAATKQTVATRRRKRQAAGPSPDQLAAMTLLPEEQWRPVVGEPDYEVSNLGRVRSLKATFPRLLSTVLGRNDYVRVRLWAGNKPHYRYVHILVAEAFIGPRPEGEEVRHRDDNKADNRLVNLLYGTRSQNILDAVRNGTQAQVKRTHCPQGHRYDAANTRIRKEGWRTCRACEADRRQRRKGVA